MGRVKERAGIRVLCCVTIMKKVLVVDDDKTILEVVGILLQMEGFMVFTLQDGEKLFETIDEEEPDLVVLDIWLPGINGDVLAEQMRYGKDEKYHNIPIILMSASSESVKIARQSKIQYSIEKPFDINDFMALVNRALSLN